MFAFILVCTGYMVLVGSGKQIASASGVTLV